jgi:hypothetical protein
MSPMHDVNQRLFNYTDTKALVSFPFQVQTTFFGHIPDSVAVVQTQSRTGEKNFSTKVDLLQSQFMTYIRLHNSYISKTHPPTLQDRDVCAIYCTFIVRQLGAF